MDPKDLRLFREAYGNIQEGYGKKKKGDCVDKAEKGEHNCAKKVCHESFGEGTCIFGEHAVPDENGFVSHYDVMFEHGVERNVPVSEMEILEGMEHPSEGHRYEGEQLDEMVPALEEPVKKALDAGAKFMNTNPVGKKIKNVLKPVGSGRGTVTKAEQEGRIQQNNSADLFDIVKGHLMSEGYADTEEAALAIMANMSEEWRQTILEADSVDKMRERAAKRRKQRYGSEGGGRDDYRPYTEDDYKNPKPGYGSSQVKPA